MNLAFLSVIYCLLVQCDLHESGRLDGDLHSTAPITTAAGMMEALINLA